MNNYKSEMPYDLRVLLNAVPDISIREMALLTNYFIPFKFTLKEI